MFGNPIVGFNVRGQNDVKTNCGGFVTMVIAIIVLLFASMKLIELESHKNPVISQYSQP